MDCEVCCQEYSKKIVKVECIHCKYSVCRGCCKTYILSSINEAKCMNCKKPWNREFLINEFTYTFVNTEYKKHLENVILEREKSKLPDTQVIIERRKADSIIELEIAETRSKIKEVYRLMMEKEKEKNDLVYSGREMYKIIGSCNTCNGLWFNTTTACNMCNSSSYNPYDVPICKCPSCKFEISSTNVSYIVFCTYCKIYFNPYSNEIYKDGLIKYETRFIEMHPKFYLVIPNIDKHIRNHLNRNYIYDIVSIVCTIYYQELPNLLYLYYDYKKETKLSMEYLNNTIDIIKFKQEVMKIYENKKKIKKNYDMYAKFVDTITKYMFQYIFLKKDNKYSRIMEEKADIFMSKVKELNYPFIKLTNDGYTFTKLI